MTLLSVKYKVEGLDDGRPRAFLAQPWHGGLALPPSTHLMLSLAYKRASCLAACQPLG